MLIFPATDQLPYSTQPAYAVAIAPPIGGLHKGGAPALCGRTTPEELALLASHRGLDRPDEGANEASRDIVGDRRRARGGGAAALRTADVVGGVAVDLDDLDAGEPGRRQFLPVLARLERAGDAAGPEFGVAAHGVGDRRFARLGV